uniref:hypothetical protein n=1 Tax=Pontiella sp. TaxID=2837462 RepID=UPI0035677879
SSYAYDEDNRLVAVALDSEADTHAFAYDYRSRRYYRSTPASSPAAFPFRNIPWRPREGNFAQHRERMVSP